MNYEFEYKIKESVWVHWHNDCGQRCEAYGPIVKRWLEESIDDQLSVSTKQDAPTKLLEHYRIMILSPEFALSTHDFLGSSLSRRLPPL
jgi:hypothetical protein